MISIEKSDLTQTLTKRRNKMSKKTKKMFEEKLKDKLKKEGINEDWMKKHLVILSDDEE